MSHRKRLGVLVSGAGTNLQAIIDASQDPDYPAEVVLVISNLDHVRALERAQKAGLPAQVISHLKRPREEFEKELIAALQKAQADLIILAGFMRILTPFFLRHYKGKILNLHPSLLPAFPGTRAIEEAWDYGAKVTGATIHFVDEGMDTGPILLQKVVPIDEKDDLKSLGEKIHAAEHHIYPEAIRIVAEGRAVMPEPPKRRVHIKGDLL